MSAVVAPVSARRRGALWSALAVLAVAVAAPSASMAAPAAPAGACEAIVTHTREILKRVAPHVKGAHQDPLRKQVAALKDPATACKGVPPPPAAVVKCLLGANTLRGLARCKRALRGVK